MAIIQPAQLATGSYSLSGSFSGSFQGNGAGLNNIPSSAIVGLSSTQIASGAVTASVSTGTGSFTVTSGSSTFMFISSSGNVGVGTTTPSSSLDIVGVGATSATSVLLSKNSAGAEILRVRNDSFVVAKTTEFNIQANGLTVPTNGNQLMFNLVGSGQGMSITNQNGTTYRIGQYLYSNILSLGTGGTSAINIYTTNNVGINTTTDAGFKLDVNGTARVTMGASAEFRLGLSGGLPAMLYSSGGYMMRWKNDATELYLQGTSYMVMRNNTQEFVMQPNSTYLSAGTFAVNTSTIIASAILQADSTTKGFLPPRTNLTSNISTPAQGLMTYLTGSTNEGLYYYNSGSAVGWHKVLTNSGSQNISGSLTVDLGAIGSNATDDVVTKIYEQAVLTGEVRNMSKDTLIHNFMKT